MYIPEYDYGFWKAVQLLIGILQQQDIAAKLLREAKYTKEQCCQLQRQTGTFDEVMIPFIEKEMK